MATVTKSKVHGEIENQKAKIAFEIRMGYIAKEKIGRIPTVVIGRVSARKWWVGWNYQPITVENGETVIVPHSENFISDVIAAK